MHLSQVAVRPIKFRSLARLPAPRKGETPARARTTEKRPNVRSGHLVIPVTDRCRIDWHKCDNGHGDYVMRKIFILFALVFALVTTATATVVTTAVTSDAAMALAIR